jgi:hypothetical protein
MAGTPVFLIVAYLSKYMPYPKFMAYLQNKYATGYANSWKICFNGIPTSRYAVLEVPFFNLLVPFQDRDKKTGLSSL